MVSGLVLMAGGIGPDRRAPGDGRCRRGCEPFTARTLSFTGGGTFGSSPRWWHVLFRVLGDLEVVRDDRPLVLGSHQQRAVLAILVLRRRGRHADRLIDGLWGDRPPATAAKTVQVYISRLAQRSTVPTATGPERCDRDTRTRIRAADRPRAARPGCLRGASGRRRGRAVRRDRRAATVLRAALALWRGAPLVEFANEPFARDALSRLEELRLEALETRIDADLALGRHAMLVAELELLVAEHPLRERLRGAADARPVSQRARARGARDVPRHAPPAGRRAGDGAQPVPARTARRDAAPGPRPRASGRGAVAARRRTKAVAPAGRAGGSCSPSRP